MSGAWIEHTGTTCPVLRGTLVDIRCKNGDEFLSVPAMNKMEALPFFWCNAGSECDIVEYRVCEGGK